jgi:hypothetical protein
MSLSDGNSQEFSPYFHDKPALLDRLTNGLRRRSQEVVFLVGSPLSSPTDTGQPGVPGTDGVIELIRREFHNAPAQFAALEKQLGTAGQHKYQAAFRFLQGSRGQQAANDIVRTAVFLARLPEITKDAPAAFPRTDAECRAIDMDPQGWQVNPGMQHLGRLLADYPEIFGKAILTTNFDPLIEVAIRRAKGSYYRTTLYADGNITQTDGMGCHVIHLHGYWYGSDTLHTNQQLAHARPHLKDSLRSFLRNKLLVICGYGGWDDVFTDALMNVVADDTAFPALSENS